MYRYGQLTEESNPLWYLEFKGYHGLQCLNDLPFIHVGSPAKKWRREKYSKKQMAAVNQIIRELSPILRDSICFYLMTMVLMLDTSNLKDEQYPVKYENPQYSLEPVNLDNSQFRTDSSKLQQPVLSTSSGHFNKVEPASLLLNENSSDPLFQEKSEGRLEIQQRFQEITRLRDNYLNLLQSRCKESSVPEIRQFADSHEGLNRAISSIKKLTGFVSMTMSMFQEDM